MFFKTSIRKKELQTQLEISAKILLSINYRLWYTVSAPSSSWNRITKLFVYGSFAAYTIHPSVVWRFGLVCKQHFFSVS
jgi:hypothetical protein